MQNENNVAIKNSEIWNESTYLIAEIDASATISGCMYYFQQLFLIPRMTQMSKVSEQLFL